MTELRNDAGRPPQTRSWWRTAAFYRVELRSFADSNGDGVGDLDGLRNRLGYLEILGVDALWLTALMGTSIDRVGAGRKIDPVLGELDSFEQLVAEAHESGLRVAIDVAVGEAAIDRPGVREEVAKSLRFWMDRGVDGFRVATASKIADPADAAVHKLIGMIRPVVDEYPQRAIGALVDKEWYERYGHADDLDLGIDFRFGSARFDAASMRTAIDSVLASVEDADAPPVWILANHYLIRPVTRLGSGVVGGARARAVALVQLALPGVAGIDNGEELGLPDAQPTSQMSTESLRGPMPWEGKVPPFGFSDAPGSWWPIPESWSALTAEAELEDPDSTLSLYRQALSLRRKHPAFRGNHIEWFGAPPGCFAFRRAGSNLICALNTSTTSVPLPPGNVLLSSRTLSGHRLPANTAAWLLQ